MLFRSVPFRDSALRVVQTLISLLETKGKKMDVSNKKRFKDEFGEEPGDTPPNLVRPDDYHAIFSGNVDDHFKIGPPTNIFVISLCHKILRLYCLFVNRSPNAKSPFTTIEDLDNCVLISV